ncbi:MAG: MaoC family dehydratase N-terminal domain-containing protein [Deltaproteobacteria bacterium]|nr:MaoC family dehydratase N-terminal domain-containing protein [Deltaproteobacteria bacterium]MBW2102588.1 MaoC family dehydratase N-terminal domain-containing protein [Deltaproteobacteria bacterium]
MHNQEENNTDKSELVFSDLNPGREFRPLFYSVTQDLVKDYLETVGDTSLLYKDLEAAKAAGLQECMAPPGLAAIYSRLSYLQDHEMPSGGVLAKQEFEFHGPIPIGETLAVKAKVSQSYVDEKGRKRVNFLIEARDHEGNPVSTTRLFAIWPK